MENKNEHIPPRRKIYITLGDPPRQFKIVPLKIATIDKIADLLADKYQIISALKTWFSGGESKNFKQLIADIAAVGKGTIFELFPLVCIPSDDKGSVTAEWITDNLDIVAVSEIIEGVMEVNSIPFLGEKLKGILAMINLTTANPPASQ